MDLNELSLKYQEISKVWIHFATKLVIRRTGYRIKLPECKSNLYHTTVL